MSEEPAAVSAEYTATSSSSMDISRMLEISGGTCGFVFMVFGVQIVVDQLSLQTVTALHVLANGGFLFFFGGASGCLCIFKKPDIMARNFFFLMTWVGRSLFFLTMGAYLYPALCGAYADCGQTPWRYKLGLVAAWFSIIIGVTILVLLCTRRLQDSESGVRLDTSGTPRVVKGIELGAAVASCGTLVIAGKTLFDIFAHGVTMQGLLRGAAYTFMLLLAGALSLLATLKENRFVTTYFGFLSLGYARGVFYMIMGGYTFGLFWHGNANVITWFCYICSWISLIVGVVLTYFGCRGQTAPLLQA